MTKSKVIDLGNNKILELSFYTNQTPVINGGFYFFLTPRGFGFNLGLFLWNIDFDIHWKGDHPGTSLRIDILGLVSIDSEYYDTRHEEQIASDKQDGVS